MHYLLRHRHLSHRLLCGMLAVLMAIGPVGMARADVVESDTTLLAEPALMPVAFDLSYVLPQSFLVIAARPAQILKSPVLEMFPYEVVQAATAQATGLDPMTADQIVISATPPLQGPPQYTAIAKFMEKAELKSGDFTRHTTPAEMDGQQYLQSQDPMAPSFYQPDDRSLLLAPDALLPSLVGGLPTGKANELKAIAAAAQRDDLIVLLDLAAVRPFIQMGIAQANMPPEAEPLVDVVNLVSRAELRINLSGSGATELAVTANDEADAEAILQIYNDYKQKAMAIASRESQRLLASDDPIERALGRYQQRMQKMGDESLQLQAEDDRIVLFRLDPSNSKQNQQLVYAATVGVLVALLLPAVQAAREAARRNQAMNHAKMLMLGLFNYESAHGNFPAHASYDDDGKPLLSWRVHILPFLEQQALYDQFHLDEPWDSEHNRKLIPLMPAVFLDPSSPLPPADGKTHYLGVVGEGVFFHNADKGRQLREIRDGTSNTIALVQASDDAAVTWTKPEDWKYDPQQPLLGLGGLHPGIFLAGFADGHVRAISSTIDLDVLRALFTADGGEVVPNF